MQFNHHVELISAFWASVHLMSKVGDLEYTVTATTNREDSSSGTYRKIWDILDEFALQHTYANSQNYSLAFIYQTILSIYSDRVSVWIVLDLIYNLYTQQSRHIWMVLAIQDEHRIRLSQLSERIQIFERESVITP